jgi:hypothetical protein
MPRQVKRGQAFEIRVMIGHPMETGYRRGADGDRLPRKSGCRGVCKKAKGDRPVARTANMDSRSGAGMTDKAEWEDGFLLKASPANFAGGETAFYSFPALADPAGAYVGKT